ncbi:MAG: hypothetical protein Fur006_60980 [Coleofasciculaceae cyanobacterium]
MFEDSKKQSPVEVATLNNVNSSTASNAQNGEADSNHPQDTELALIDSQDLETDPNNHEGAELLSSNVQGIEPIQEPPEETEPSDDDSMEPPPTPMLSQFWWFWRRKKPGGRR